MARWSNPSDRLRRLEQLAVKAPIALVTIDARGRVRCCNPAFEKLFLYGAREARGKSLERLVGLGRTSEATSALRDLTQGRDIHLIMEAERKDRSVVQVEFFGFGDSAAPRTDHWAIFHDVAAPEGPVSRVTRILIDVQEEERLRIAHRLHDDIGQRLVVWQFAIDRLKASVQKSHRDSRKQIAALRTQAVAISHAVRDLSREIYPPTIMLLGPGEAIEQLCGEMAVHLGMDVRYTSGGVPSSVRPAVTLCLFRVVQDALRNAAGRGDRRRVTVDLRGTRGEIRLVVRFDRRFTENPTIDDQLRLIMMRERIASINGTFSKTRGRRTGAVISVTVPL